jgi:N4-gp56 family major capsid protein
MTAGPNTIGINGTVGNTFTDTGIYYVKEWLERLKPQLRFEDLGEKRPLPKNSGTLMKFRRVVKLTAVGTAPTAASYKLTENTNPASTLLTTEEVTVEPVTYGQWAQVPSELKFKSINPIMTEFTAELADNGAAVADSVVRTSLSGNLTNQFVGQVAENAVTVSNILTPAQLRQAVYTLRKKAVPGFEGDLYKGVLHPAAHFDLSSDTGTGGWIDINKYSKPETLMRGEVGQLYGIRFVVGQNVGTGSGSGTTTYHTYIFGRKAFGISELAGQGMQMILKEPGTQDTSNPLNMYSTVGWKFMMAAVVLDSARAVQIYSGSGAV